MKTAVEWLKKELEDYGSNSHLLLDWNTFDELCEQAKELEKQQIKDAYEQGEWNDGMNGDAEQYYNQKFKNSNVV